MKHFNTLVFAASMVATSMGVAHAAPAVSDPESLGIQAGSMEYCRDNFSADQKERKQYDALRSAYIQDLDKLADGDKQRALEVAAMVGKKGNVGGKKLSESRCDQMRKASLRGQLQQR